MFKNTPGKVAMATKNFFDLLGDDENEDPTQVVIRANSIPTDVKPAAGVVKKPTASAKLPTKPTTSAEAVKGRHRGLYDGASGGRGFGRGGRGDRASYGDRDIGFREAGGHRDRNYISDRSAGWTRDAYGFVGGHSAFVEKPVRSEDGDGVSYEGGRGGFRGRGRDGRGFGDGEERPRRHEFDRQSGTTRGYEAVKRAGAGRGNWGTEVDVTYIQESLEAVKNEEPPAVEIESENKHEQEAYIDAMKTEVDAVPVKAEEEEDNEMTLEEYEKVLEGKRKALEADKASERKVEVDKAFEKMQLVDYKKREEDIFIKLGQDKDKVNRESAEREDKSRKPVSINEFLKPAEGEKYYGPTATRGRGGRAGRGDRREGAGRGDRDLNRGTIGVGRVSASRVVAGVALAPKIEDQAQFPTLGGK